MSQLFNILAPVLVACFFLVERSSGKYRNHHKSSLNKERPASFLLGPPLTEEEIVLTLKPVLETRDESHFDEFIQLYKVTNGLKTLEAEADGHPLKDIWLIPGYYLMSLHEVVETLSIMMRTSGVWNPSWLPLFASRAGDFVILTKESLRWEVASSLQAFIHGITKQLRDGIILLNENGLYDVIITDSQKHEVYEDTILDSCVYVSPDARNTFNIKIVVHEENVGVPNLDFDCTNIPRVCQNIKNAIARGKTRLQKNRRAACSKVTCTGTNNSCDEYPFASTSQGGAGATTMCVPLSENNSQGGTTRLVLQKEQRKGQGLVKDAKSINFNFSSSFYDTFRHLIIVLI
ncbi:hypothetical protein ACJMK2_021810 [Sinanodonta woodiana]|uniref:Deoxyribonuclease NucA/NucB domain-containing protein n=1 Tax=Sinanodonta woodiana TaxID=1069815 RepID=A0ABD3TJ53_SINWO